MSKLAAIVCVDDDPAIRDSLEIDILIKIIIEGSQV